MLLERLVDPPVPLGLHDHRLDDRARVGPGPGGGRPCRSGAGPAASPGWPAGGDGPRASRRPGVAGRSGHRSEIEERAQGLDEALAPRGPGGLLEEHGRMVEQPWPARPGWPARPWPTPRRTSPAAGLAGDPARPPAAISSFSRSAAMTGAAPRPRTSARYRSSSSSTISRTASTSARRSSATRATALRSSSMPRTVTPGADRRQRRRCEACRGRRPGAAGSARVAAGASSAAPRTGD